MKNKLLIYPFSISFIAFSNSLLLKLHSSQQNADTKISVEYLEKLPLNDYIIGSVEVLNNINLRDIGLSSLATVDGEGTIYLVILLLEFFQRMVS